VRNLHSPWIKFNVESLQSKWTMHEFLNHIGPITCYLQLFINKVHFLGRRLVRISCDQINCLLWSRQGTFSSASEARACCTKWKILFVIQQQLVDLRITHCLLPPCHIFCVLL
jgi:hypothetical protein